MPAAIPIIAAQAIVSWFGLEGLTALGVYVAGAALGSVAQSAFSKAERSGSSGLDAKGLKTNSVSTDAQLKVVYGEQKIGGNIVYASTFGTDNDDLWIVLTLAEGLCNGIKQVDGVDQVFLNDELYTEYPGLVTYYFHNGAADQTYDTNLNAVDSEWTDNLRNTCYLVVKLGYDQDYFQGVPNITVILEGKLLYDPRDETSSYTDNAALCLLDYLTCSADLYGMGFALAEMDLTSFESCANYCDSKAFGFNGCITGDDNAIDVINMLCTHFRGQLVWFGGCFYARYSDINYESSVMTLTDDDIVHDETGRPAITITQPGRSSKPDALKVKFISPDKKYTEDCLPVGEAVGIVREFLLKGCISKAQAYSIGIYNLERMRLDRVLSGTFRDNAVKLDPHDIITLSCSALGIESALMRVSDAKIRPDGLIDLTLVYESSLLYDDDFNLPAEGVYTCTLPDPTAEPPNVANAAVSETTYIERGRRRTRVDVAFDEPTNYGWFDHVEVWVSFDDVAWSHMFNARNDFIIDPVEEGQIYYIRLKSVNIWGVRQQDANDLKISRLIQGHSSVPDSVGSVQCIVNAMSVNLYADPVDDSDIDVYEFRLGSTWNTAIFMAALTRPNLSLYGVKPGTHTFILNTKSNNGFYGSTPRSKTVSLPDPPHGWTVQGSTACDYSSGTHDNTEQTTYSGDDYLKCSHTGGVLTGTYTTPVYDLGSSTDRLVYITMSVAIIGLGTTWDDVIPAGVTWADIDISRPWYQIFELPSGAIIRISLFHGDTNPPTDESERMEILSTTITGQYIFATVEITDPSTEINALVSALTITRCT